MRTRQCVQDMSSLMRSQLLGGRGAVRDGHRKRRGAPVRNVQAHAGQQRTRAGAEGSRVNQ